MEQFGHWTNFLHAEIYEKYQFNHARSLYVLLHGGGWQEQHAHETFLTGFLANISNMGYIDLLDRASGFKVCCNIRIFRFIKILLFLLTSLYVCDTTRQQSPELILNECVRVGRSDLNSDVR